MQMINDLYISDVGSSADPSQYSVNRELMPLLIITKAIQWLKCGQRDLAKMEVLRLKIYAESFKRPDVMNNFGEFMSLPMMSESTLD